MYCLLCHEKIPRLRAWRTKSEFCSDEHAAQYKKQTLDRLLTDQNPARKEKPDPIALSAEPEDDLLHDEMSAGGSAPEPSSLDDLVAQTRAEAEPESDAEAPLAVSSDRHDADDSADGVEELWRLAEETDHSDSDVEFLDARGEASFEPDVSRQSAEDALRALRMLADKATESDGDHDHEPLAEKDSPSFLRDYFDGDDPPRSLEEIEELPPLSDDLFAELGDELPDFEDPSRDSDPVVAAKDALSEDRISKQDEPDAAAAESPQPAADDGMHLADDAPSILDRLMEDPSSNWSQKSPATSAPTPVSREQPPAADDLDDDPLADFADLPEPDFAFEDDLLGAAEASEEPVAAEPQIDDAPLDDIAAADDDLDDEPELDPLAELIKAEEAAQVRGEDDDESAFDEAVADELVKELAEEALRDDLDLQELERNLKVVPFPSPNNSATSNGLHKHADQIAEDIDDDVFESHPLPGAGEPTERTAAAKRPPIRARPPRPGGTRTRFKPSMVMAGVEPAIQGYLQGDPLESWRVSAVESVWGQRGLPSIHAFEAASPTQAPSGDLEALRPSPDFRGRMSLPLTVCTPAEPPAVDAPTTSLEPTRSETPPQSPQALSLDESASIRLGPEYRAFDDVAAVTMNLDAVADAEPSESLRELLAQLPGALEPSAVFYDSVSIEARFADEDEWDVPVTPPDQTEGIDLSADFADEQPAAQSSGGRRQY